MESEGRPRRLGVLVPSSNTVVELETAKLLPEDGSVTMHVSRLRVVSIASDDGSLAQFAADKVVAAAELLADAEVETILWNGTAASWLGFRVGRGDHLADRGEDRHSCDDIHPCDQ